MKIQEADAKSLLAAQGLPVPAWEVARTAAEARAAAERVFAAGASKVVIKAQVLVGGRGKAGGVQLAADAEAAERIAARHPVDDDQGHPGPQGPRRGSRRHRQGVLPLGPHRPRREAGPRHGLGRGRRRDRGGRGLASRGDRPGPRSPVPRPRRPPGSSDGLRPRPRRPRQGIRGHRDRPRPDDAGIRRRPRRGQPARDRPRDRGRRRRPSSGSSASTPR